MGKYLWVRVVYTDTQDARGRTAKTADVKSDYAVRAAPAPETTAPPTLETRLTDTRTVSESVAVGANVGAPVTATIRTPKT